MPLKGIRIRYTFPIGDNFTGTVGPLIENYYMLAATPSVYKPGALKAFKLGGHGAALVQVLLLVLVLSMKQIMVSQLA